MNLDLPFSYHKHKPNRRYRALKDGELIEFGDTLIFPDELFEERDGVNVILTRIYYASRTVGGKVRAGVEGGIYLRRTTPNLKECLPPLLDYWLGKYQFTCEDEKERRVWEDIIDTLTPEEPK